MQEKPTTWTAEQNLKQGQNLKQQGNIYFNNNNYKKALRCYHQANLHLQGLIDKSSSLSMYSKNIVSEELSKQISKLKFNIFSNMAQIYLKQKQYQKSYRVLQSLMQANQLNQPKYYFEQRVIVKMKYRLGVTLVHLKKYTEAKQILLWVISIDPKMKNQVTELMKKIQEGQKEENRQAKNFYQKFFK